jgi:hypothetical protein
LKKSANRLILIDAIRRLLVEVFVGSHASYRVFASTILQLFEVEQKAMKCYRYRALSININIVYITIHRNIRLLEIYPSSLSDG